ncbi:MAG: HIT family protein [Erysipelotrichaceae bacterium]|nr:HIT family protein [Erysipelotrichaceae bacterium]
MSDCIFCKIINHEIPGKIVYEDDVCLAFLDLSQTTDGHTLVIPKQHFNHILDVDADTLSHMIKVVQIVAKNIENKLGAKGFNIVSNMNEIAGQSVHHFHIHIIPRYNESDGFKAIYTDRSNEVDLDKIYTKLVD